MERIEQKEVYDIDLVCRSEFVYIEQTNDENGYLDVIQVEKSSIPALIAALQKHIE